MSGGKMANRKFFIETHGCQMNQFDSQVISEMLTRRGWVHSSDPKEADIIMVNTCGVRERAERKAFSRIQELSSLRKIRPWMRIGIIGCVAQRLGDGLVRSDIQPDFVIGPGAYHRLADLLLELDSKATPVVDVSREDEVLTSFLPKRYDSITALVAITKGCNNRCTYCVVPHARGREISLPHEMIIDEISHLVGLGVKEVTLIGQNVNSYNDGKLDFPDLLRLVNGIEGLLRIRFTTSHPKDLSTKLITTIADLDKVCNHIHLPLQSGSDRILALMNRGYRFDQYKRIVDMLRDAVEDIAITTDIIVGFPTETIEDHRATLDAIYLIEFDAAFMFKYSPRPGTEASLLCDDVPDSEKTRRLTDVITLQNKIIDKKRKQTVGKTVEILVESESDRHPGYMIGRTSENWLARLPKEGVSKGQLVRAKVVSASRWMLTCEIEETKRRE